MPTVSRPRLSMFAMLFLIVIWSAASASLAAAAVPAITVDPSEGRAGKNVTVAGDAFQANGSVALRWNAQDGAAMGEAVANSAGQFSLRSEFPRDASPGNYTIFAVQGASTATFPVVVSPPSTSSGTAPAPPATDEVFERALDENEAKELAKDDDADEDPAPPAASSTAPGARATAAPKTAQAAAPAPAPAPVLPLAPPAEVPLMVISSAAPSSVDRAPLPSLNDPRLQGAFSPSEEEADVNTIALRMLAVIPFVLVVLAMMGRLRYALRSGTLWAR